jgi:hypothetical protein
MANTKTATAKSKMAKNSTAKSVLQMTTGGRKLKRFSSMREAGLTTGVDPSSISKATRGILQTAGGFRWATR